MRSWQLFLAIAGVGFACASNAETPGPRAINEEHPGYVFYRGYCATCHGVFADGNGPVAPLLRSSPPDLSRLAQRHGRPLPREKLIEFIAGREMARSHGNSDMPIWGQRLYEGTTTDLETVERVKARVIERILDYLESIQVEG